ncbi:hypothetical protein LTR85_000847 [Meristemomyces frigidus]|nr:hypothetical protein LTR85_000847 [Meristemomyces frigidus]
MSGATTSAGPSAGQDPDRPLPQPLRRSAGTLKSHKDIIKGHVDQIFASQLNLQQLVEEHGLRIVQCWEQSDRHKRVELLRVAYPLMPRTSIADSAQTAQYDDVDHRAAHYSAAVNTTDLAQEDFLPHFLFNRAAYQPYEYATADIEHTLFDMSDIDKGEDRLSHEMVFQPGGKDMHGRTEKATDARAKGWRTWTLRRGLLVVETQAWLYPLLVRICESVLAESTSHGTSASEPAQPMPDPKAAAATRWFTAPYFSKLALYKRPCDLDMRAFDILVDGQLSDNVAEYAELRVDPLYFTHCILSAKDRASFSPITLATSVALPAKEVMVTQIVIGEASDGEFLWNWLRHLTRQLVRLQETGSMLKNGSRKLTEESIAVFKLLEEALKTTSTFFAAAVTYGIQAILEPETSPSRTQAAASSTAHSANSGDANAMQQLLQLTQQVYEEVKKTDQQRSDTLIVILISEIQAIIDGDRDVSPCLTPPTLRFLTQLTGTAAYRRHLSSCQPLTTQWRTAIPTMATVGPLTMFKSRWSRAREEINSSCRGLSYKIDDERLKQPADSTTKKGRQARKLLDRFWTAIDNSVKHMSISSSPVMEQGEWWTDEKRCRTVFDGIFVQIREDAEWMLRVLGVGTEAAEGPAQKSGQKDPTKALGAMRLSPTSGIPHGGQSSSQAKSLASKGKQKEKSRPET